MLEPASIPVDRKALLMPVYSEALDPSPETMLPDHVRDWKRFQDLAPYIDGVFAHTPWMAERVSEGVARPGFVLPVGWGPPMGNPVWKCEKRYDALFAGSMVGRRAVLLSALQRHLGVDLCAGVYGPPLIDRMNVAKVTLYVAHSPVRSYSTWRIWQALCSSSALATEPGDWWPLREDLCIPLPQLTLENVNEVAESVQNVSASEALERARALRQELSKFTTRYCVEKYMIDGTRELSR
jgi:hypothetical protein